MNTYKHFFLLIFQYPLKMIMSYQKKINFFKICNEIFISLKTLQFIYCNIETTFFSRSLEVLQRGYKRIIGVVLKRLIYISLFLYFHHYFYKFLFDSKKLLFNSFFLEKFIFRMSRISRIKSSNSYKSLQTARFLVITFTVLFILSGIFYLGAGIYAKVRIV